MSQISRLTLLSGGLIEMPPSGSWASKNNVDTLEMPFESKPLGGFKSLAFLGLGIGALLALNATTAVTDAADGLSAAATLPVAVTGANQNLNDTMASAATVPIAAATALQNQGDTVSSAATLPIGASASLTDASDRVVAVGSAGTPGFRSLTMLPISLGAVPYVNVGNASLLDKLDTASAAAGIAIAAAAAVREAGDLSAAFISTNKPGFRSLAFLPISIGTIALPPIVGSASLVDARGPSIVSTAGNGVLLTSINGTSAYRITATPDLAIGDRIEVLSAVGGPISEVTINADATFTMAIGSTVSSFDVRVWSIVDQDWGSGATQFLSISATTILVDLGDRVQAFGGPVIGASVALTDKADNAAAAGLLSIGFNAALYDSQGTLAAALSSAIAGSMALTEQPDQAAAAAVLAISIAVANTDLPDLLSALAAANTEAILVSALQELGDTTDGAAVTAFGIAASLGDQADRIAADVALPTSISGSVLDLGDGLVSIIDVARSADAALTDTQLELVANAAIAMVANFTGLDRGDILRFGANLVLAEKAGGFVATLMIPARTFTLSIPERTFNFKIETGKHS